MRHSRVINHLGRTNLHRKAMLANMATSLIIHKRITTTTAKAKALKTYIEPLITKSKEDSTHSRRVVFSYLKDKDAVAELFREISPKVAERPGGYTRILKTGNRIGDNAEMCILELVDYNESMLGGAEAAKGKTRRRRSPKKKAETEAAAKTTDKTIEVKAETTESASAGDEGLQEPKDTAAEDEKE
ncbi:MAG TPA: 50S ribosomal protein L17 [Bacteroidales bacterium]|jgi:large subunit ribosomal protein L17|nr:50S ribosomal protein L17 [Bacteroidales bacterium]